jgi:lipopolysaccharide/colanic/teichoic acid biosynthesis glycosyltransferase
MDALALKRLRTVWELVFSYVFLASAGLLLQRGDRPYLIISLLILWSILFFFSYLFGCYDFERGTAYGIRFRSEAVLICTLGAYLLAAGTVFPWLTTFPVGLWIGLLFYLNLISPMLALPAGKLGRVPALCVGDLQSEQDRTVISYWGYDCTGMMKRERLRDWLKENSDERRWPKRYEVILMDLRDPENEKLALDLSRIYFIEFIGVSSTSLWSYLLGRHYHRVTVMPMRGLNRRIKRLMDIILSVLLLIVLSPFLLLIVLLIKLDSPGPVLYRHWRVGKDMRHFRLLKFRTMFRDADQRLQKILAENPELKQEYEANFKLKNDPRVTRFGQFLRSRSLDEMPQLFNIIKDQMSWVGPRPIVDGEIPFYEACDLLPFRVAPGATGLWQISGRNETGYERRVQLDIQYVRHWSYWLDVKILLGTIPAVLGGRGAY